MQVVWAELEGNLIEKLIGVMLCRRFPFANRIQPSQGDGGIDVLVPVGDGRVDIYQIKGFTRTLNSSQKRQVKKSLARVAANTNVLIRDWYLVVPVNPTQELKFDWFVSLVADYEFDCHWFGLDQCEGLAADYPEAVRYYLGDGRHELEQAVSDLRAISPLALSGTSAGELVTLDDLRVPFAAAVETVNRADPHFRYELMVTKCMPFDLASPPPAQPDGLDVAAVVSQQQGDAAVVTILIIPRYAEALLDRPIGGTYVLPVDDDGKPVDDGAARFLEFGVAAEFAVKHLSADLPGGLSQSAMEALIRVGPATSTAASPYELRLVTIDDSGEVLGEALCQMEPVTTGIGPDPGLRASGASTSGLFRIEIPMRPQDGTCSMNFRLTGFAGKAPAAIAGELWFLHSLASASLLRVGQRFGPLGEGGLPIGEELAPMFDERLPRLIDDLAVIQRELLGDLRLPELDEIDVDTTRAIRIAAALLRGGAVRTTYEHQAFTLPVERRAEVQGQLGVPLLLEIEGNWQAEVFGRRIVIEPIVMGLRSAILSMDAEDESVFVAVPAEFSDEMLIRRVSSS